jgi:Flp pilus assembly protein CpaB
VRVSSLRFGRLRRHPAGFWLITLALAGLTASTVARLTDGAAAAERRWAPVVGVAVVRRSVAVGAVVRDGDVVVVRWPDRLVPRGAVRSRAGVVGRVALVPLWPGEPVLRWRLAPDGLRGLAALVPAGMRAVAVPVGDTSVRVAVGDTVDVLATVDAAPAVVVVAGARVVDGRDGAVTLAVTPAAAARLAYALAHSTLTLALSTGISTRGGLVENGDERP